MNESYPGTPVDAGSGAADLEAPVLRAARALTEHLDLVNVSAAVLDAVEDIFGATASWLLLHDDSEHVLRTVACRGEGGQAFCDAALPPDAGVLGLAFDTRKVIFVPDVALEQRWFDANRVHASPLRSAFIVPLVYKSRSVGIVGLDSPRFTAAHPPGPRDTERLEALAAQAAIAIANARLYDASERDRRRLKLLLQDRQRLRRHVTHLRQEILSTGAFGDILGESRAFTAALEQAALVAPGDTTVLLFGETGTGKELLARFLHERSGRARGPFVAVNCAALPEALVESELFGHERGAFTGAIARKPGKFEIAHRGTLFLDEIGDLPPEAQAKLLRILQDGQVQRVGSTAAVRVDVRVVAATNQDLEAATASGRFRADLYYRLSVFPIHLPPLRERTADIPLLAQYFLGRAARKLRRQAADISERALRRLSAYDWPGNVRELQNVMERAVILTPGSVVEEPAIGLPTAGTARDQPPAGPVTLAEAERRAIERALAASGWRISGIGGAADILGLKPTTLHAKMRKLGFRRPAPRRPHGR